jgi:hypothetical protein
VKEVEEKPDREKPTIALALAPAKLLRGTVTVFVLPFKPVTWK